MTVKKSEGEKRAIRVWLRLTQSYGMRLAENYGSEMPKPWSDVVEACSDEQLAHGLRVVVLQSPLHPPTLGQFQSACQNMPVAQHKSGQSIQEQLCAYATLKIHGGAGPVGMTLQQFSRSWFYYYREGFDAARPKGMERTAECMGVIIELDEDRRMKFTVADMLADVEGHARALQSFKSGKPPSDKQLEVFQSARDALITKQEKSA